MITSSFLDTLDNPGKVRMKAWLTGLYGKLAGITWKVYHGPGVGNLHNTKTRLLWTSVYVILYQIAGVGVRYEPLAMTNSEFWNGQ